MPDPITRHLYVQRTLALYRLMPGTTGHVRLSDRQLAGSLHDRGIDLHLVSAALLLAAARRTFRHGHPLPPISTLHDIRPVIDELLAHPADTDYFAHICRKLAPLAPAFAAAIAPQLP